MKTKGFTVLISVMLLLAMCFIGCPTDAGGDESESAMTPASYTETAFGYLRNSEYNVTVVVGEHEIRDIFSNDDNRDNSATVGKNAIPVLIERILEEQTAAVDVVAGATITSTGFLDAVDRALQNAGAPGRMFDTTVRTPIDMTVDCDVLIIGAGMAGLSAARSAKVAAPDKNIVLIDMTDIFGGAARMCGSILGLPMTESQADRDNMANWFQARAQGDADMDLLQRWADEATASYRLITGRSATTAVPSGLRYGIWPRMYGRPYYGPETSGVNEGGMFVDSMARLVKNSGVVFMTGVKGTELIEDASRKVVGAKAEARKGINYTFNTRGGVIIATGSFGWDEELMTKYHPGITGVGPRTQDGSGIRMGEQVDADMLFKGAASTRGLAYGDATRTDGWYTQPCITSEGIWPGSDGLSYTFGNVLPALTADEAQAANYTGYRPPNGLKALTYNHTAYNTTPLVNNNQYITNWDSDVADWDFTDEEVCPCTSYRPAYLGPCPGLHEEGCIIDVVIRTQMQSRFLQDQLAKKDANLKYYNLGRAASVISFPSANANNLWSADSPAALAAAMGESKMTAEVLEAAYEGMFAPLPENAPAQKYYAVRIEPITNICIGGIMIDRDGRALRDGNAIPGLYAAGEVALGQFFYLCYPTSGGGLSIAMTYGSLAGHHAATGSSRNSN